MLEDEVSRRLMTVPGIGPISATAIAALLAPPPNDDEGIEQFEANRWDNKQVHGANVWSMITQEGSPSLVGWHPPFDHVLAGARLRELKPQLKEFAVDAWRAPKRIFDAHPPDQYTQLRLDPRSPDFQRQ